MGLLLGEKLGDLEGLTDGEIVGFCDVGNFVGETVGTEDDGLLLGERVGLADGFCDVGSVVGDRVGNTVGNFVGALVSGSPMTLRKLATLGLPVGFC